MANQCDQCGADFSKLSQLLQHRQTENHWPKYGCPSCKKTFTRKDNLERHMSKHRDENNHHCPECLKVFTRRDALDDHFRLHEDQVGGARKRSSTTDQKGPLLKKLKSNDNPRLFYTLTKVKSQRMSKFKTTAATYKITFKNIEVTEDVLSTLRRLFTAMFKMWG